MITLDTIELAHFIWLNRFGYTPFISNAEFSLNGAQHIEVASKQAGRPITLYSDGEALAVFVELENHASTKGAVSFEVNINGRVFMVVWDYRDQAISGSPAINYSDENPEQIDAITLKLITV